MSNELSSTLAECWEKVAAHARFEADDGFREASRKLTFYTGAFVLAQMLMEIFKSEFERGEQPDMAWAKIEALGDSLLAGPQHSKDHPLEGFEAEWQKFKRLLPPCPVLVSMETCALFYSGAIGYFECAVVYPKAIQMEGQDVVAALIFLEKEIQTVFDAAPIEFRGGMHAH